MTSKIKLLARLFSSNAAIVEVCVKEIAKECDVRETYVVDVLIEYKKNFSLISQLSKEYPELLKMILFSVDDPKTLGNALVSPDFIKSLGERDLEELKKKFLVKVTKIDKNYRANYVKVKAIATYFVDPKGRRQGKYIKRLEDGVRVIKKFYKDGKKEGTRKEWYPNGKQLESISGYKNGKREGEFKIWYPNGILDIQRFYKNGREEGEAVEWYVSGNISSRTMYKNGKKDGLTEAWHENGVLRLKCYYKDDIEDGEEIHWYDNGNMASKATYKDGHKVGAYNMWYDTGEKSAEIVFDEKKKNLSHWKEWYENGNLAGEYDQLKHRFVGERKVYYDNGQIKQLTNYKHGEKEGPEKEWHKNGKLKKEALYKKGKKIKTIFHHKK